MVNLLFKGLILRTRLRLIYPKILSIYYTLNMHFVKYKSPVKYRESGDNHKKYPAIRGSISYEQFIHCRLPFQYLLSFHGVITYLLEVIR
jgi:hypothetical protein